MRSQTTSDESTATIRASRFTKSRSSRVGSLLANVELSSYEQPPAGIASKVALGSLSAIALAATAFFALNSGLPTSQQTEINPSLANAEFRSYAQDSGQPPASAYDQLIAAIDAGETPPADLYVAAAQELLLASDGEEAKIVMQMASVAYPDEKNIYLAEQSVKSATGGGEDVWTELAQSGQTGDPEVMGLILKIADISGKIDETLVLLGDLNNLPWEPTQEQWNKILDLLVATGQIDEAIDLAAEKLGTAPDVGASVNGEGGGSQATVDYTAKFEALKEFDSGDYKEALKKQIAYLNAISDPTPADYDMLARIYLARGNTAKADEAYEVAEGIKKADAIDLTGFGNGKGKGKDEDDD